MVESLRLKLKEQKGFTLIELLAVIVILGIIAAIAIPAITSVIGKSDNKAKVQEGIQIINAAKLYVADNRPPTGDVDKKQLEPYLDKVQDASYVVTIELTAAGKYTYSLKTHESVTLADGDSDKAASEQELLEYVK